MGWGGEAFEPTAYEDSSKDIKMFSLEKEKLRRFLISILKYLKA